MYKVEPRCLESLCEPSERHPLEAVRAGIRAGIIAREAEDEAWTTARQRFPEDCKLLLTHHLVMKTSDSIWQ
jgi:hypothetical protein